MFWWLLQSCEILVSNNKITPEARYLFTSPLCHFLDQNMETSPKVQIRFSELEGGWRHCRFITISYLRGQFSHEENKLLSSELLESNDDNLGHAEPVLSVFSLSFPITQFSKKTPPITTLIVAKAPIIGWFMFLEPWTLEKREAIKFSQLAQKAQQ